LFDDPQVAAKYGERSDAYRTLPTKFRQNPLSQQWRVVRNETDSRVSLRFEKSFECSKSRFGDGW